MCDGVRGLVWGRLISRTGRDAGRRFDKRARRIDRRGRGRGRMDVGVAMGAGGEGMGRDAWGVFRAVGCCAGMMPEAAVLVRVGQWGRDGFGFGFGLSYDMI